MLDVKDLKVNYGNVIALSGVSFRVDKGQIVSLIGANGAGKTTALMAISGMVPKAGGTVSFLDKDISKTKPHEIAQMGISHIPEGRRVFPKLSVENNLITGTCGDKNITKVQQKERLDEMYILFPRLFERKRQNAGTLSGGEQQMLAIARGMMSNPTLVMLDEPSLGLAPVLVEEVFMHILKIRDSGKTILLIEQNSSAALQISDYAYVVENGAISLHGTGEFLMNNEDVKRAYLGI